MISTIYQLLLAHMIGDYVLQIDFIAKTKGQNRWHMLAHCITYTAPFFMLFGFDWRLAVLLGTHIIVDEAKARYGKINYVTDQILHMITMGIYLI